VLVAAAGLGEMPNRDRVAAMIQQNGAISLKSKPPVNVDCPCVQILARLQQLSVGSLSWRLHVCGAKHCKEEFVETVATSRTHAVQMYQAGGFSVDVSIMLRMAVLPSGAARDSRPLRRPHSG